MDSTDQAWNEGNEAGAKYFNDGISREGWHYLAESPYPKGSPEDEAWKNGYSSGIDSAESSYEADY
jgi:hypothetical protein